jgi:hypothetical protein
MPNVVIKPIARMLRVIMLNIIMQNAVMLNAINLNVVMLNAFMMIVVAPLTKKLFSDFSNGGVSRETVGILVNIIKLFTSVIYES